MRENKRRLGGDAGHVSYQQADIFDWKPDRRYDTIFFSYWLSHVPPELFETYWERVAGCLAPTGRVFLIDNLQSNHAERLDPEIPGDDGVSVLRPAPDGRMYRVWKVLWRPDDLREALSALGWAFDVYATGSYFMWAEGRRSHAPY
ncbi:MAG: class I SAM-dependent methyltransferase [Chloroflexota bacterium]